MITVEFWATIDGSISEREGLLLWQKIQHGKEINFMVLESQAYVYGRTSIYVLVDVLRQFNGYPLQLNIK